MKASIDFGSGGQSVSQWPSLVIQGIALSINVSFILKDQSNTYFHASIILLLSLSVLQVIYRRFLMLFPKNFPMNRPSPHIDTYVLRGLIWISYFLLFLGIYRKSWPSFPDLPGVWIIIFSVSGFLILPLIFWILSSTGVIQHLIAKKLGKEPFLTQLDVCPYCKFHNVNLCREIISSSEMRETISCPNCKGRDIVVSTDIGN